MPKQIFRPATTEDAPALKALFQVSIPLSLTDIPFTDLTALRFEVEKRNSLWVICAERERILNLIILDLEPENRLARIRHMIEAPDAPKSLMRKTLAFLMKRIRGGDLAEVVYCTTRAVRLRHQELTLKEGFVVLGVFPNALSADSRRINGLTAWYSKTALTRRYAGFRQHPAAKPFYDLARAQLGLEKQEETPVKRLASDWEEMPTLEVIEAPLFAAEKFRLLKARRSLSVNFFPFQNPNVLITSPDQYIEVYAYLLKSRRFATIIGERLTVSPDPVALYHEVSRLLQSRGADYIEIINDAADTEGIDCILRAGYAPCGYLPALKDTGEYRRDYVVFGLSFDASPQEGLKATGLYSKFLALHYKARAVSAGKRSA